MLFRTLLGNLSVVLCLVLSVTGMMKHIVVQYTKLQNSVENI